MRTNILLPHTSRPLILYAAAVLHYYFVCGKEKKMLIAPTSTLYDEFWKFSYLAPPFENFKSQIFMSITFRI